MDEKAHDSDWGLIAQLMGQACQDPRAMANLNAAHWRDISRSLWGAWTWGGGAGPEGESRALSARAGSTGPRREARLFSPSSATPGSPLVVMLHGCMQDSDSFAKLTRMDEHARERGFSVLYPDQDGSANAMQCWNWSAPENHARLGGEPEALAGLIRQAQALCQSPPERTRLAGMSAGAALAAGMAYLYPELMGSAAVVAGPAPFSADTAPQALRAMAEGPDPRADMGRRLAKSAGEAAARALAPRALPILIVQGLADETVNPKNADAQEAGALMLNDALNQGRVDGQPRAEPETSSGRAGGGCGGAPGGAGPRVERGRPGRAVFAARIRPKPVGSGFLRVLRERGLVFVRCGGAFGPHFRPGARAACSDQALGAARPAAPKAPKNHTGLPA